MLRSTKRFETKLPLSKCYRRTGLRRLLAAGDPGTSIGGVEQEDASHLLDRVWIRLRRVPGADNVLGVDAFEMRAAVLDDAIVAALDRPVAVDRDDRMRVDAGDDRHGSHGPDDRVAP